MSEARTYTITSVNDFLGVPEDRLADCLEEFRQSIKTVRATIQILQELVESQGNTLPDGCMGMPSFTWIDDGHRNQRVIFGEAEKP